MVLRLLAAFGAGCAIGWERESHGRPAGLRTNILACVAAAVAILTSQLLTRELEGVSAGGAHADVTRIGSGVLTGIGFLGAGTIIRHGDFVRGVTTAASLWFATILGLAFGCGFFVLGGMGLGLAMFTLLVLPQLENLTENEWYATLRVTTGPGAPNGPELQGQIEAQGPHVVKSRVTHDLEKQEKTFAFELSCKQPKPLELANQVLRELSRSPGVVRVEWD